MTIPLHLARFSGLSFRQCSRPQSAEASIDCEAARLGVPRLHEVNKQSHCGGVVIRAS
jgi:hypothetical protein